MRSFLTNTIRFCLLLLAFIPGLHETYAQNVPPSPVALAFEKKIPDWLKETNVPAVGIGIIEKGELKYTKVFGKLRKSAPGAQPVLATSNTIFQVASLTKPVVEILTLQLVTSREWNLDDDHA